ncbi:MAG: hypothetical protein ACERKO_03475 [Acetanaerobacterium sp.]
MKKNLIIAVASVILIAILTACSPSTNNPPPPESSRESEAPLNAGTTQNQAMDKASSESNGNSADLNSEDLMQLPAVQEAYQLWTSFGGHPPFSTPKEITANSAAELYANYCINNKIDTAFFQDAEDVKMTRKWIPAADLEPVISRYFGIEPDQIRKSDYFSLQKGYLYPDPMAAQADQYQLLSTEDMGNSQLQLKIEYTFKLPPELYGPEYGSESKTVYTVTFLVADNKIRFLQAAFENIDG